MTSRADIGQGDFDTLDVERLLESYALATRLVASEPFVRRIHVRLAQEPPLTRWRMAWRSVRGLASTAFGREQVAAAVRLQALALLILGALALGIAVGGAGAVVVSLVREVTEAPGPHRPNEVFPVATGGVTPSVPSAAARSTNDSPAPKPKTGGSHSSGDAVRGPSQHPTHVRSAAGGGQPTPAPRSTRSPRPTQAPPTATPSDGGETPSPTIATTPGPTVAPTPTGTPDASPVPSPVPSSSPEQSPEASATPGTTAPPTATPTAEPVPTTTPVPSIAPTVGPTPGPSPSPS